MIASEAQVRRRSDAEGELLAQFAAGDLAAFETLFRQYQAEVYGWIVRIIRDSGAAEDVTIETFWRIYRARQRFDTHRSFGPWARRIATNAAIDYLKTVHPEQRLIVETLPSQEPDAISRQHLRQQTQRAFRELPAQFQAVATLALVEERPYEDISQALGISVSAVKSRVFRAVRLLRKNLKRLGVEP